MLVHYLPGVVDLLIDISNPHREIDLLVPRVGATGMEDRVTVTEHPISNDTQFAKLTFHSPFEKGEKFLPVLAVSFRTDILSWWKGIKNKEIFALHICFHNGVNVLGAATRNKLFINFSYLLFIGGRCLSGHRQ